MNSCEHKESVRVVLADDHIIVRHAIRTILKADPKYSVIAECSEADDAINKVLELKPDLLILDLGLPGKSGVEAIFELSQSDTQTKTVVLTMFDDETKVRQSFTAGARGYILKDTSPEQFLSGLDTVLKGGIFLSDSLVKMHGEPRTIIESDDSNAENPDMDPLGKLSKREREVFYLLADGMPNRVIAKKLFISPRTVETHRARVIKKLGFNSTADLIRYAIRNNLLTL